jgi:hypothetical protein
MVSAIKTALESQPAVGGFGVISFTSVGNTPLDPVPIVETDNSAEQLAIILGVSIPALLSTFFFYFSYHLPRIVYSLQKRNHS